MKVFAPIMCVVALTASASMAQSTQNFQLLVPFEKGVKLEFYGAGKDGVLYSIEGQPRKILYDGAGYWLALIDEDLVFSGQFQIFCVQDRREKWTFPETVGKSAGDLVCDLKPTDNGHGTFIFDPTH